MMKEERFGKGVQEDFIVAVFFKSNIPCMMDIADLLMGLLAKVVEDYCNIKYEQIK